MQVPRIHLLTSIRSCKRVALFPYITSEHLCFNECHYSTSGKDEADNTDKCVHKIGDKVITLPPPPTNCCMSGCHNCVWLIYAEELKKTLCCSSEENMKIILDRITDPNMKAFLKFEMSYMSGDSQYRPTCPEETPKS